ncbi:MAG: hypothetical protein FE041_05705 [Thermoplasmata archaeon]|nr:MAG: hypothetical protein FE041_05705 [Thermoplasmata archaeon]
MLIQCAADFHGRKERYAKFLEGVKKEKPHLIILAGDFGYVEDSIFDGINVPIYGVVGNMDGELNHLKNIKFIDNRVVEFRGLLISGAIKAIEVDEVDIIISHIPPYKTKDRAFFGMHIGDKKLREIMNEKKPKYIICGHIHEDAGYGKFGGTIVVNCSIGKRGEYTLIDTEKEEVKMVGYL